MSAIADAYITCEERGIDPDDEDALDRLWWVLVAANGPDLRDIFRGASEEEIEEARERVANAWCAECGTRKGPFRFATETEVCEGCHDFLEKRHDWTRAKFGTKTCVRCGLLPTSRDDLDSDCGGGA